MEPTAELAAPPDGGIHKRRILKRAKGGDQGFSAASSTPVSYGNLVDEELESRNPSVKRSFRDTVTGQSANEETSDYKGSNSVGEPFEFTEEMFANRILIEEKVVGKYECPAFTLSKWEEARIQRPWQKGLIVKLLGRRIGFKALETRLNQLWVLHGVISIIDLSHNFFLVMFTNEQDREFALTQGPWLIYDHYLIVREWCANFQPEKTNVDRVAVWVRFSGLPIEYYDPSFLHFVGNRIGRTVKVDKTTLQRDRGKYARLCVEVDLQKPLLAVFEIKNKMYRVEYEGLHLLCLKCGRFGHYKEGCTEKEAEIPQEGTDTTKQDDTMKKDNKVDESTMWTIVQKVRINSKKKPMPPRNFGEKPGNKGNGSRYNVLHSESTEAEPNISSEINNETPQLGSSAAGATPVQDQHHRQANAMNTTGERKGYKNRNTQQFIVKQGKEDPKKAVSLQMQGEGDANRPKQHQEAAMDTTEEPTQQHNKDFNMVRYEDVASIDKDGNVVIETKEISVEDVVTADFPNAPIFTGGPNPSEINKPRPPDKPFDGAQQVVSPTSPCNPIERVEAMDTATYTSNLDVDSVMGLATETD